MAQADGMHSTPRDHSEGFVYRGSPIFDSRNCDAIARRAKLSALWLTDDAPDCPARPTSRPRILGVQPLSDLHGHQELGRSRASGSRCLQR
jgi:hypothetical protein